MINRKSHTCEYCGLIWWGEMLNLVSRTGDDMLGNYCPNCGGTRVVEGIHE